jgi:ribosomal protein S18 acetylase RimI-like enzyme
MEIITDLREYNMLKKFINRDDTELKAFDKSSTYYIYFIDSIPVGRITIHKNGGIWDIMVAESMRGKGICTKMLQELIDPNKFYFLHVKAKNEPAIKCYKKFGFKIESEKNGIYYMTYGKKLLNGGSIFSILNRLANIN